VLVVGHALLGPTPSPSPSPLPPPPECATDLFPFAGSTLAAQPLPSPASSVGGEALTLPGRQVALPAGATPPPPLRGTAWLVADARTGDVLAACNAHLPLAPASTLKVLTALALIDVVPPTSTYSATAADASIDGTRAGLVAGSRYTADNLWHGLLLSSANDCAHALAELAGGQQKAANTLQDKAYALGAADTRVVNTSGLDAPGQVSSAYDLALFARAALAEPRITALARTRSYTFPAAGTALHGAGQVVERVAPDRRDGAHQVPGQRAVRVEQARAPRWARGSAPGCTRHRSSISGASSGRRLRSDRTLEADEPLVPPGRRHVRSASDDDRAGQRRRGAARLPGR